MLRASKNSHWQIVVPSSLLLQVLQLGHDSSTSGHQSAERTFQRISDYFWWPEMNHDVTEYVKTCKECGARNHKGPTVRHLSVQGHQQQSHLYTLRLISKGLFQDLDSVTTVF